MQTQVNTSTHEDAMNPHKEGLCGRDAWDEDMANNDEPCRRVASQPEPFSLVPSSRLIETRDDLSFTGRILMGNRMTRMDNWLPPRLPEQVNQWNLEKGLGVTFAEEVMALRKSDEHAAHEAIRYAVESRSWRTGGHGVESGFAHAIAALAVVGMRALEGGAEIYEPL